MAQRTHRRRRTSVEGPDWLYGRHVIEAALGAGRRDLRRLLVRAGGSRSELEKSISLARKAGIPVVEADSAQLAELAGEGPVGPRGAVLEAGPLPELDGVAGLCDPATGRSRDRRIVVLDGVEDPQNVGSIARVSDAAGADGLVLTRHHSPPLTVAVTRASAGAIEWLPVARVTNLARALDELKRSGFWVIAADPEAEEGLYTVPDRVLSGDLAVVLGAEGRGLRPGVRRHVDHLLRIPMLGQVESLNVATAGAVLLYELMRRNSPVPQRGNSSTSDE